MPLAFQSCQAVEEEGSAASFTTDLARVCRQQSQPPLLGWNGEISGAEEELFGLWSCLGRCGWRCLCPGDRSEPQQCWWHRAPLEGLPGMAASFEPQ